MKNLAFLLVLFCLSKSTTAQELKSNSSNLVTKETLLLKSKKQKKAAKILLITGGSVILLSGAVAVAEGLMFVATYGSNEDNIGAAFAAVFTVGLLSCAASIPFYIAAGHNKRKAASISFQQQKAPFLQNNSIAGKMVPAVSIKINF